MWTNWPLFSKEKYWHIVNISQNRDNGNQEKGLVKEMEMTSRFCGSLLFVMMRERDSIIGGLSSLGQLVWHALDRLYQRIKTDRNYVAVQFKWSFPH